LAHQAKLAIVWRWSKTQIASAKKQAAMHALQRQGNDSERALMHWMDKLAQAKK